MTTRAVLAALLAIGAGDDGKSPAVLPPAATFAALGDQGVQDLLILGETRPILIRLRVRIGDQAFRSGWDDGNRRLHKLLDRDHDGKLTVAEAEAGGLALLLANPAAVASADVNPKDGALSVEELAEALRATHGPFQVQSDGLETRRTDALFDQFDRDKDGRLTRPELATIVGSLRKLDRDDNELIGLDEVAATQVPESTAMTVMGRPPTRELPAPSAISLEPGEPPLRVLRLVLKKYDKGSARGPGKTDSRLSPEEFAIPKTAFTSADKNGDGLLNTDELRSYLEKSPREAILDVAIAAEPDGRPLVKVRGLDGGEPVGLASRQLSDGIVELDLGLLRLDIHLEDGHGAIESARQTLKTRFDATDANQDGYLEQSELTLDSGQASPISGLFKPVDRNGDGKVYWAEINDFVTDQANAARGRLTLTASDQGRALFGLLDLDRDRQLGAREVLDTFARVSACDHDQDGRIVPEEIPHHIQLTLARGDLSPILAIPSNNNGVVVAASRVIVVPPPTRAPAGPIWFRKMDRNHDGDVSRREFLGTHDQFDRLDRDHDGLIGPDEAEAARPAH